MRLILLGAPGAGKGSQAAILAEKLKVPHISTGDIFRENIKKGTELGRKAKEYMDKGALVPDEVTVEIVEDRLRQSDCSRGFILDGFPRTITQAEFLDNVLKGMNVEIDYVVDISVSDETIIRRLSGRRVCRACGAIYHIRHHPPETEGVCDSCKSPLIQRDDDREETVVNRLNTYHRQTEPLIEYYGGKGKLVTVSGEGTVEDTSGELLRAIGVRQ
jgi:adenylate kinase